MPGIIVLSRFEVVDVECDQICKQDVKSVHAKCIKGLWETRGTKPDNDVKTRTSGDTQTNKPTTIFRHNDTGPPPHPMNSAATTLPKTCRSVEYSVTTSNTVTTTAPGDADVLMGRGKAIQLWSGNRVFSQLVDSQAEEYGESNQAGRRMIAMDVIEKVHRGGGWFLQRVDDSQPIGWQMDEWVPVDAVRVMVKVKQALRDSAAKQYKRKQEQESEKKMTPKKTPKQANGGVGYKSSGAAPV